MSDRPTAGEAPWLSASVCEVAARILQGHLRAFGRPLLAGCGPQRDARHAAQELFATPTVVLAHDGSADPRLIYANRAALLLWRQRWDTMVGLPSRLTAEPGERLERAAALEQARLREALQGYGGIRIDSGGRRFRIENARLWTLRDRQGTPCGQAATFARWWWL
ncbi:MEKHLA domain-containing protein [Cyanobium sp. FGCU-52]|nr:MEKHLA domain-containing protein [Cyanobium sp. FGCU52]